MENLMVFTDGSCVGNGSKNALGGIGIYFPNKKLKNISMIYPNKFCTNQRTELYAILTAIKYINKKIGLNKIKLIIKTDSQYSINCITKWTKTWIKNKWITSSGSMVSNREYIEDIYHYYLKYDINFEHVESHTGNEDFDSIGNSKADKLATSATQMAKKNKSEEKINVRLVK